MMSVYHLIDYRSNYSKISGRFWQYYNHYPKDNLKDSVAKITETDHVRTILKILKLVYHWST